ncbi:hypothetical protein ACHAXH_008183 [Discostella pseudostelligera]|jgi:hypothetical protein
MELKLAYATLLSVAALIASGDAQTTTVAATTGADSSASSFDPPASVTCLASNLISGGSFVDCCPSADPNDGICTIVWCVDIDYMNSGGSLIRDNCDCGSVETACAQLAQFADLVPGLEGACAAMGDCCEAGVTANSDFASCTQDSLTALNATLPDYNVLIPGGVPDLDALISTATNATAASGSTITTVAAEATATGDRTTVTPEEAVAATEAEAATTVAAATIPAEITTVTVADSGTTTATEAANTTTVPAEKEVEPVVSGASAYAVNAAFSFIVTSLVGYFV